MSLLQTTRPTPAHPGPARRSLPQVATFAVVAGVLLGIVDLALQRTLPYPWADLANSSAVWAVAAFGVGAWVRAGRWQPAAAGAVTLVVAVEAYYLAAILTMDNALGTLWSSTTVTWLVFGVAAGVVFGVAGAWSRRAAVVPAILGLALAPAVLFGEALLLSVHTHGLDPEPHLAPDPTAVITAALGLVVVVLAARRRTHAFAALVLSLPLAVVCLAAFRTAGFGV